MGTSIIILSIGIASLLFTKLVIKNVNKKLVFVLNIVGIVLIVIGVLLILGIYTNIISFPLNWL